MYSVPIVAPRHRPAPTARRAGTLRGPRRSAQAAATHIAAITCPKSRLENGSSNVPTISAIATTVACRGYTVGDGAADDDGEHHRREGRRPQGDPPQPSVVHVAEREVGALLTDGDRERVATRDEVDAEQRSREQRLVRRLVAVGVAPVPRLVQVEGRLVGIELQRPVFDDGDGQRVPRGRLREPLLHQGAGEQQDPEREEHVLAETAHRARRGCVLVHARCYGRRKRDPMRTLLPGARPSDDLEHPLGARPWPTRWCRGRP